jgi:hypothetical protein
MLARLKSSNYVTVRCSKCPTKLKRRRGVVNPLCEECKAKRMRARAKGYAHVQKTGPAVVSG